MLDQLSYDGDILLPDLQNLQDFIPTKLAYIDSSNASIQIGESEFNMIKTRMMS